MKARKRAAGLSREGIAGRIDCLRSADWMVRQLGAPGR
jgi:hypothetical protein